MDAEIVRSNKMPLFLTTEEMAKIMRVSRATVAKEADGNLIPGAVKHGSRWRFRRADVERWLGVELCAEHL